MYSLDWDDEEAVCSRPGCGLHNWDDGCPLEAVQVLMADGEEMYAEITQILCNQHLVEVINGLIALGFISHNHHGTQQFGPSQCESGCSTPVEYGPELVLPDKNIAID